jgi:hypothetical protein
MNSISCKSQNNPTLSGSSWIQFLVIFTDHNNQAITKKTSENHHVFIHFYYPETSYISPEWGKRLRDLETTFPKWGNHLRDRGTTFPKWGNHLRDLGTTFPKWGNRLRDLGTTFPEWGRHCHKGFSAGTTKQSEIYLK